MLTFLFINARLLAFPAYIKHHPSVKVSRLSQMFAKKPSDTGLTLVWHLVPDYLWRKTVENVPFGGSRLFSVNTDKLNHYNPVPSSGAVLIRSDWKCVRAQMYRDKKRVCILRAGFGGVVHVLHRMESYSEINCQAKWSISVFRRRQSHVLTYTQS